MTATTTIGGFLPLENPGTAADRPYHAGALALTSGRVCWHVILRTVRPKRVRLPFYICDAVLQPLEATRTPFVYYRIDEAFRPAGAWQSPPGELTLVVNYFGVQPQTTGDLTRADRDRIVIDDTQAFFRHDRAARWTFNSARKFFGVPDGAYLYGPVSGVDALPPSDIDDCDHLIARRTGADDAWERFKAHESRIGIEPRAMSDCSRRLLSGIDMNAARRRRAANFETLHRRLGALNRTAVPLDAVAADGPMCYPFMPDADVNRMELTRRHVFVPTLWPEIDGRSDAGFAWERRVARRLLPLPIDHRYGSEDMERVADVLLQVM